MIKPVRFIFLTGVILISGCTLYTKPEVNSANAPEVFKVEVDELKYSLLNNRWWENFHDPKLSALVEQALENNYNYLATMKNIEIAQTYVLQNMTGLFPQIGLDYSFSRNKGVAQVGSAISSAPQLTATGAVFDLQLLSAAVNYEIDVWNQVHNQVDQSKADKDTAIANTNVLRLTLVSSVVNTYFQIMASFENIDNLNKQYEAAVEILELTEVQFKSGLVDEGAVYQAQIQVETIFSTLKALEKQKQIQEFTLAYLLGKYPEEFSIELERDLGQIRFTELVPDAIPGVMLGIRPDIQAAYSSVLSYGYIEKQNIANFLPNFSLSGLYGYANQTFAHLINPMNLLWDFGIDVLQPIVNYPLLYAQWKRSQVQYEQATLAYKNTVINAFAEVDGSLVTYKEDNKIRESYARSLESSLELLGIADAQYKSGLSDYSTYLTTRLSALQTEYNLTLKELTVTQDIVQVYKAIGLGTQTDQS